MLGNLISVQKGLWAIALLAIVLMASASVDVDVVAQSSPRASHEIFSLENDGKARVKVSLELPERFMGVEGAPIARAECGEGEVCYHGLLSVVEEPGRGLVGSFWTLLPPGESEMDVAVKAFQRDGSAMNYSLSDYLVPVPDADPLDVEFDGYQVSGIHDDGTVDLRLDFTLRRPDAWPISEIGAIATCEQSTIDRCAAVETLEPGWEFGDGDANQEIRWRPTLFGVPTGSVRISSTFFPNHGIWSGPPRTAGIYDIEVETSGDVEELINPNVEWSVTSTEVKGYHMDGAALVDLTLSARHFDDVGLVDDEVACVCLTGHGDFDDKCQSLSDPVPIRLGSTASSVVIPELRLPPGQHPVVVFAGGATGRAEVEVEERFIMPREMWDCFLDDEGIPEVEAFLGFQTCSGFSEPTVRKWVLDTVNVYREGHPLYVRVFDEVVETIGGLTGIEYVLVDDVEKAHVEAYVGHEGHPRVLEVLGEECNDFLYCSHSYSTTDAFHSVDRGIIGLRYYPQVINGEPSIVEGLLRAILTYEALQVFIPVGPQDRPFLQGLRNPATMVRDHDATMFRLIYSPEAVPGTDFSDLRDLVVFEENTIDYQRLLPPIDLLAFKMARAHYEAGSITVDMIGSDVRGRATIPGTRLTAQFADFLGYESQKIKFTTESWRSIIFGFDQESWSSAGGRWTRSDAHTGRGRRYRDELKFDFPLADPTRLIYAETRWAFSSDLTVNSQGKFVYRAEHMDTSSIWPNPDFEIVIDPETYLVESYTVTWYFDANDDSRLPYRVEATVLEYGAEFEIPDEIQSGSEYLSEGE